MDQRKRVFVSGHGNLSLENWIKYYKPRIDKALQDDCYIILGDYVGCDTITLEYLKNITNKVVLCHIGKKPRYFPDKYNTLVKDWTIINNFKSDEERDTFMTNQSDYDIAYIEKGRELSGTVKNILRRKDVYDLEKYYIR